MSEKTLIEQGKDVSRALRNRCIEIAINFEEKDQSSTKMIGEEIISSPGFLQELQIKQN